jgi:hypothetical protein
MKTLKVLAAVALLSMSAAASAQGYYQGYHNRPPPVINHNYTTVYPGYPVYNAPSFRYEHLYGAAIVGAVTGVILENATRPPVVVQQAPIIVSPPARDPVTVTREEWVYDPACDCKRRQVYRSVH